MEELEQIECFKNVISNLSGNNYNIYVRIINNESITKDILNNIDGLDYEYLDFGIFKIWFSEENKDKVIKRLKEEF